jgi:diadenosine tetraphosphatase ApaH/serine/threonine PP2A family protein phosphatase
MHALEAVLQDVDAAGVDELWSLGDHVGYGPRPNECCAATAARSALTLAGNHDLAVRGDIDLREFAGDAGSAASWTRTVLDDDARAFLAPLEPTARADGVELYHGSPRDPVWEYVLSDEAAAASLTLTEAPVVLVGHSHVALVVRLDGGSLAGGVAPGGTELELGTVRWLLNPGSVGQPRDGDPRAAWLLLDLAARTASYRRVEYPIDRTQAEIREAGLPPSLGARLARGE